MSYSARQSRGFCIDVVVQVLKKQAHIEVMSKRFTFSLCKMWVRAMKTQEQGPNCVDVTFAAKLTNELLGLQLIEPS